jgi:hypothetical protein
MHIDLRTKFQIASKLDEVVEIKDGVKTYAYGWTDQRLARELGVTAKHIQAVRRAYAPEMVVVRGGGEGRPPRNIRLREAVAGEIASFDNRLAGLDERLSRIESLMINEINNERVA